MFDMQSYLKEASRVRVKRPQRQPTMLVAQCGRTVAALAEAASYEEGLFYFAQEINVKFTLHYFVPGIMLHR